MRASDPPTLLRDVIPDPGDVVRLLESQAPYRPLGGWYNPGADMHARNRPMWFQHDWVHADFAAPGSDLFLQHPAYLQAARDFYGAEIVEPKSVYVNVMAAIADGGPAHTDNCRFDGRDRTNTPMWLLRTMFWSGLFDEALIAQATAIWWMSDVEGGSLYYWPDGPDHLPTQHAHGMANTALIGDNHGMFHQVGPVGPFDAGTRLVTPSAELAPVGDGSGDWSVLDHGELVYQAPLDAYRVSVLWKADVYLSEDERAERDARPLSMQDVADRFNRDLAERGVAARFEIDRIEDPALRAALNDIYPPVVPRGALPSVLTP